jgi:hypothetical protein
MSTEEKLNVLRLAECSGLPKDEVLKKFDAQACFPIAIELTN